MQVLFFSRLLADVCGRTIPRVKRLAVHSRMTLFGLGCFMTASIPAYLYYIRASPWHSDWAIIGIPLGYLVLFQRCISGSPAASNIPVKILQRIRPKLAHMQRSKKMQSGMPPQAQLCDPAERMQAGQCLQAILW